MYFHKKLFGSVVFFGLCSFVAIALIYSDGYKLINVFLLLSSLGFVAAGLSAMWRFRNAKEPTTGRLSVKFSDSTIYFPDGYHFKQSSVAKTKMIRSEDINEVNPDSWPPSLVINNSEVVFLTDECKNQLQKFVSDNGLKVTDRFDIWEHLNQPFLDTEFTKNEKESSIECLVKNGFTESEIAQIRKRLKWTMWMNMFAMEWAYLGQFDYLRATFLTNKKYWWTMEVALRNYKRA